MNESEYKEWAKRINANCHIDTKHWNYYNIESRTIVILKDFEKKITENNNRII